jgi:hypothetical protein
MVFINNPDEQGAAPTQKSTQVNPGARHEPLVIHRATLSVVVIALERHQARLSQGWGAHDPCDMNRATWSAVMIA